MFPIVFIGFIALIVYFFVISPRKDKARDEEIRRQHKAVNTPLLNMMNESYNQAKATLNIPLDAEVVGMETTVFGMPCAANTPKGFFLWFDKSCMNIFPTQDHLTEENLTDKAYRIIDGWYQYVQGTVDASDIHYLRIPVPDIEYYKMQGEIEKSMYITGGGGGGSSITGAIVGGLIAGEAGAIIGSRKEVEGIKTHHIKTDKRETLVVYKEADTLRRITLSPNAYEILLRNIPDRDYEYKVIHQKADTQ